MFDFDTDALEKDLEEYKKVMEDSFPKPVDGEKKTGDIDWKRVQLYN